MGERKGERVEKKNQNLSIFVQTNFVFPSFGKRKNHPKIHQTTALLK